MTKNDQDLQMANLANHAHPISGIQPGLAPLTGKFRRAIKASQYKGSGKPAINTNYREKAKIAAQNGEIYDEAADRALQTKKLEQLKQYKQQRRKELSAAIQKRFNTAPEHLERSLIMRAAQDRIKAARKIAEKHKKIANQRNPVPNPAPTPLKVTKTQANKHKTPELALAAS